MFVYPPFFFLEAAPPSSLATIDLALAVCRLKRDDDDAISTGRRTQPLSPPFPRITKRHFLPRFRGFQNLTGCR